MTRDDVLTRMRESVHYPATARDLARILKVPREQRPSFTRDLKALVASGDLVQVRGNRLGLPEKMDLVVGRLHVNPAGFGFVSPERNTGGDTGGAGEKPPDIYIPAHALSEAMHGDVVVVRVERHTEKGLEGRLVRILERAHERIVGRFDVDGSGLGYVVPFDRRLVTDVHVPTGDQLSAEPGDMVVVTVTRWPSATRGPVGRVSEVLGRIDEPGVDTQIIIRKFGIPDAHSPEAVEEARAIGGAVREIGRASCRERVFVGV